jgi:glycyl-tRNA synthetase
MANTHASLDKITAWAKRRGFVYPSSTIYGGMANVYDFGHYGTILKENLKQAWLKHFVQNRDDIYAIDSSVILNPQVWESSGHTAGFADVMVEDLKTKKRYRADHLIEERLEKFNEIHLLVNNFEFWLKQNKKSSEEEIKMKIAGLSNRKVDGMDPDDLQFIMNWFKTNALMKPILSPDNNELNEPRRFNQLFITEVGIIAGEKNKVYLRGEIAQGLFMNFKNIIDSHHPKLPFGIGQVGKAFRNEITPGKFTFRTLEFDLMEFEYFFDPFNEAGNPESGISDEKWNELFEYWKSEMHKFAIKIGLKEENLRWREHEEFERSFYSKRTEDLEYDFPWGFKEMWGIAYRTDYDLKNHQEKSGQDLQYVYGDGKKILPHVVEPTFGLSRLVTVLVFDAYTEEEVNGEIRTVLKFAPQIAPVQVAVFPLLKKDELVGKAKEVYDILKDQFRTEFDNAGNIGKMYRRQDEIGTPFCVTIDFDTLEQGSVTVRNRDTMQQERVAIAELQEWLAKQIW